MLTLSRVGGSKKTKYLRMLTLSRMGGFEIFERVLMFIQRKFPLPPKHEKMINTSSFIMLHVNKKKFCILKKLFARTFKKIFFYPKTERRFI